MEITMKKMIAMILFVLSVPLFAGENPFDGPRFIPNSFFGTTTHVNGEPTVAAMKDLNMYGARTDFIHHAIEPTAGVYSFEPGNWVIKSADTGSAGKLDIVAVVTTYETYDRVAKDPASYEKFAFAIASKYKGRIKYWEASNEPHMTIIGEKYVTMLKAFYKGIKRADPENKVVLAGFAGDETQELDLLYKLGGKDYFDILNSHSYTRPLSPEDGGYVEKIKGLYRVMKKNGDDKPCWVTEIGWNGLEPSMLEYAKAKYEGHRSCSCTQEEEARYLARAYLISASIPWIHRVYFFHLNTDPPYSSTIDPNADAYIGIYTAWGNGQTGPKDSYYSLKTVIRMINESTYQERLNLGRRIWALVFTRKADSMLALWSLDDNVTLTLKDSSIIKSVTSMVGTPILIIDNQLKLSGRPIYLSVDPKNLDALKSQIRTAKTKGLKTFALSLGMDLQKSKAAEPALAIQVANNTARAQEAPDVNLKVSAPWLIKQDVSSDSAPFKPEEEKVYSAILTGPAAGGGEVFIQATAALSNTGTPVRAEKNIHYALVPSRPQNFKADGRLDEWARIQPIVLGQIPDQRDIVGWTGPDDCSAKWYWGWDDQNFYFAAEVKDDTHVQIATTQNGTDIWRDDSIQIAMDLAGDAKPSSNVPQYDGQNDIEFGLALAKSGPFFYVWVNPQGKTGLIDLKDVKVVRDEKTKTTTYEAAIPWSLFGRSGSPANQWMGFNILVNDNDGPGRKGALQWSPGMIYSKDPSLYAKVLFYRSK
jgi:hypothetical protein